MTSAPKGDCQMYGPLIIRLNMHDEFGKISNLQNSINTEPWAGLSYSRPAGRNARRAIL